MVIPSFMCSSLNSAIHLDATNVIDYNGIKMILLHSQSGEDGHFNCGLLVKFSNKKKKKIPKTYIVQKDAKIHKCYVCRMKKLSKKSKTRK